MRRARDVPFVEVIVFRDRDATRPPVDALGERVSGGEREAVDHPSVHAHLQRVVGLLAIRRLHAHRRRDPVIEKRLARAAAAELPVILVVVPDHAVLTVGDVPNLPAERERQYPLVGDVPRRNLSADEFVPERASRRCRAAASRRPVDRSTSGTSGEPSLKLPTAVKVLGPGSLMIIVSGNACEGVICCRPGLSFSGLRRVPDADDGIFSVGRSAKPSRGVNRFFSTPMPHVSCRPLTPQI